MERDDAQIPDEQLLVAEETQPVRIEVKIIDSASEDKAKIMEPIIHEIHDSDAAVVDLQETSVQTITSEKPLVVSDLADNKLDIVNGIESNSEDVLTENVHTIQVMTEESDPNVDFYPEETVNELVGAEVSEETIATIVQPESINQGTPSEEHPAIIYEQSEKQVIDEQFSTEQVDTEQSFIEPQLEVHDPVPQLQEVEVLSAPDVLEAPESDVEHVEEHSVETIFYQRPVETIQLLQVIESKISESEPEKFIEVESIMDRLGEVLSQTETPVETDELSMQDKSEVT